MQPLCSICRHSQRSRIDQDLMAGRDLRALADEFGLRPSTLRGHRDEHVTGRREARVRRRTPARW